VSFEFSVFRKVNFMMLNYFVLSQVPHRGSPRVGWKRGQGQQEDEDHPASPAARHQVVIYHPLYLLSLCRIKLPLISINELQVCNALHLLLSEKVTKLPRTTAEAKISIIWNP
jgi:hypothetical protein